MSNHSRNITKGDRGACVDKLRAKIERCREMGLSAKRTHEWLLSKGYIVTYDAVLSMHRRPKYPMDAEEKKKVINKIESMPNGPPEWRKVYKWRSKEV